MRVFLLLHCLLLLLCAVPLQASETSLRYRCLPDTPQWQPLPPKGLIRILENDHAMQRRCEIHAQVASSQTGQWLTLGALAQSSVDSLPPAPGQAPAQLQARSSRSAAFSLNAAGEALLRLQVHLPIGSQIGVQLEAPADFLARDSFNAQVRTSLLCLLLALGLAGALFARALRDSTTGWYAGFTLALTLIWAMLTGHAISPGGLAIEQPWLAQRLLLLAYTASLVCGLRFAVQFCNLARLSPRLNRALRGLAWLILGVGLLGLLPGLYAPIVVSFNLIAILALLAMFLPGMVSLRHGEYRSAAFYAAGWLPVIVAWLGLLLRIAPGSPAYPDWLGQLASQLMQLGLLPDWLGSPHSRQIALVIQATIFALALADRTARQRRRRERQALTDKTTGLPNRAHFLLQGNLRLAKAGQHARTLALFDIAEFSTVNETLGYENGDRALREIGQRLQHKLGKKVLLARVGGKQFAALLNEQPSESTLALLASGLGRQSLQIDTQSLDIRLRCAAAYYPNHGLDQEALLRRAEMALQAAKRANLTAQVYHQGMERDHRFQLSLISALRTAMEQDQLQLFLQPKAHSRSGQICGAEVLLRWQHPQHGLVSPQQFLPFAERSGLIVELTRWMLVAVLKLAKQWQEAGLNLQLSVNLSATDLADPSLPAYMADFLMHSRANPRLLTLEITESEVMRDPKLAVSSMQALRTLGFKLALDDFGTGNSALAYLQDMPVSEIKIDRSFVTHASQSSQGRVLIQAIVALAQTLGLHTVAEGVETAEQWQMLSAAGCDEIQGYLLAAPMPVAAFEAWLGKHQPFSHESWLVKPA